MIHPTAMIDPEAQIASDASIGAYAVIQGPVKIASGAIIHAHSHISGWTTIGARCEIHPFAVVGNSPQDYHYHGEESYVILGEGTIIREFATVHRGTQPRSATIIGRNCMIMAKAHVGHNCTLGDGVVLVNSVECSGHVEIGHNTVISGRTMIHQFARIGRRVMCAAGAQIRHDIPPFFLTDYTGAVSTINKVGLRREEFSREIIAEIREAYRILYRSALPFKLAVEQLSQTTHGSQIDEILSFINTSSKNGIAGPPTLNRRSRVEPTPAEF